MLKQTPSQTVGPFFSYGLTPQLYGRHGFADNVLVREETAGERIRIEGAVLDGAGAPVRDAVVEIWQADAHGRYAHPADGRPGPREKGFIGFGRAGPADLGRFRSEERRVGEEGVSTVSSRWAPH